MCRGLSVTGTTGRKTEHYKMIFCVLLTVSSRLTRMAFVGWQGYNFPNGFIIYLSVGVKRLVSVNRC